VVVMADLIWTVVEFLTRAAVLVLLLGMGVGAVMRAAQVGPFRYLRRRR
jgi:hypothetical protein